MLRDNYTRVAEVQKIVDGDTIYAYPERNPRRSFRLIGAAGHLLKKESGP